MRTLIPDNRLNSIRCAWDGAADNSPSRKARGSRASNGLAVIRKARNCSLSLSSSPSRYGLAA